MACGDEIPVTIEYRRLWFGPGTLIDPTKYCVDADTDCCGSGSGVPAIDYPACCGETFETALDGTFVGPFPDTCISTELITGDGLIWNTEHLAWEGSTVNVGGSQLDVSLWCDADGVFYGTALIYRDGVYFDSFDFTLEVGPDGTTLVAELDVPTLDCEDNTVSIEITHPCGVAAPPCPGSCPLVVATVTDETGDCTCLPATLIYVGSWVGYESRWTTVTCEGNLNYDLVCEGGYYKFFAGSTECELVSWTESPFTITYQLPDLGANCGGSGGTAKVTLSC
jgi:hypothetical protein